MITMKYRSGLKQGRYGTTPAGMFSIGTKNPDKSMEKVRKNHAMNMACCCVRAVVDMRTPTPRVEKQKTMAMA